MKNFFLIIYLFISLQVIKSQDVDREDVKISYTRYPMVLLVSDTSNMYYNGQVKENYISRVESEKADYDKTVLDEKSAQTEKQKEYDKKKTGEKLLGSVLGIEQRPQGYVAPKVPYFSKSYDCNLLTTSYLKIPGYRSGDNAPITIDVLIEGFSILAIKDETIKSSAKNSAGIVEDRIAYVKTAECKHQMYLKVSSPTKGLVFDGYFEPSTKISVNKTEEFGSQNELEKYWNKNQNAFLSSFDERVTRANLTAITNYLDNNFGIKEAKITMEIYTVKSKKVDYTDYANAYSLVLDGYSAYNLKSTRPKGIELLKKAIEIYEKALAESNLTDKKARINAEVTGATRMNLAIIYTFLFDFEKADSHLNRVKILDIGKFNRRSEALKKTLAEIRQRYNSCFGVE